MSENTGLLNINYEATIKEYSAGVINKDADTLINVKNIFYQVTLQYA